MDRGEDIRTAFNKGKISIEEIVSAITFLNCQGIVHGDIKPENIVFHEGKAKLIDTGIATKAHLSTNGEYYVEKELYSTPYIDIEYRDGQENSIKCEIYALAMTYLAIMTSKFPSFGDVSVYTRGINTTSSTGIDWFFRQAGKLQQDRPSIKEILETAPSNLIVRVYTGTVFSEPLIKQGPEM